MPSSEVETKFQELKGHSQSSLNRNTIWDEKYAKCLFMFEKRFGMTKEHARNFLAQKSMQQQTDLVELSIDLSKVKIMHSILNTLLLMKEIKKKDTESTKEEEPIGLEAQRNNEKQEKQYKLLKQSQRLENELNELKEMEKDLQLKKSPAEIAKSVGDCNLIEEKRCIARKEVAARRRNNQLRAANLNRGLVMEEDDQEAPKSSFNLTKLEEALPAAPQKRAPRMKRTSSKLQDLVMNSMNENRLLRLATAAELCSMNITITEENS